VFNYSIRLQNLSTVLRLLCDQRKGWFTAHELD